MRGTLVKLGAKLHARLFCVCAVLMAWVLESLATYSPCIDSIVHESIIDYSCTFVGSQILVSYAVLVGLDIVERVLFYSWTFVSNICGLVLDPGHINSMDLQSSVLQPKNEQSWTELLLYR